MMMMDISAIYKIITLRFLAKKRSDEDLLWPEINTLRNVLSGD